MLYPSDPVSAVNLVGLMADTEGIVYIRTTRGAYPVIYGPDDRFAIGGSKVVRSHDDDSVALIGAGVTLARLPRGRRDRSRSRGSGRG